MFILYVFRQEINRYSLSANSTGSSHITNCKPNKGNDTGTSYAKNISNLCENRSPLGRRRRHKLVCYPHKAFWTNKKSFQRIESHLT